MFSKTMTNRMKAAAIAALMCLSVAATSLTVATDAMLVDAVSIGTSIAEDGKYVGYTADLASSGIKTITFTCTADYTGNFTYGFGIGTAADPYWEEVTEGEVAVTEGQEFKVTIDVSKLNLSYTPSSDQYPGKYEFRNYYSASTGKVTIVSAEANSSGSTTTPTEPSTPDTPESGALTDGSTTQNKKSGAWDFVDNGDGTGTMTATQARQLSELGYLLTAGYDEDTYAAEGVVPGPDDPINSHKFSYADFGLSPGSIGPKSIADVGVEDRDYITIESLEATITSDTALKRFMYGGGLNVLNESPADTESVKRLAEMANKENAGYWYNDMGAEILEECIAAGCEFEIEVGQGYDITAGESTPLGEYFSVIWDVPTDVQPYANASQISFQFWYGELDAEEYTPAESVTMEEAILTYTEKKTFDFTDIATTTSGASIAAGDMSEAINYADMGLDSLDSVKAIVFTLDVASDLDKLVYGIGTSVGEDWAMYADAENGDAWNFVLTDVEAGSVDICWIVPDGVDINEEYGNVQLGYWYGGKDGTELSDITLESVAVYYHEEEEPTTEEPTTEPTTEALTPKYGDVNCDGAVDVLDIIVLNRNLLGVGDLTAQGRVNADVDVDGTPTGNDSLNIMKYIVKLIDSLPV